MDPKEKLLNYVDSRNLSETTRARYLNAMRRIGNTSVGIKSIYSTDELRSILAQLRREKCRASALRFYYYFLKTWQERVQEQAWPLKKADLPEKESELEQPLFETEEINGMIGMVKESRSVEKTNVTLLAISTTYGVRRIELCELTQNPTRIGEETIHIKTAKKGRIRTHLLPAQIRPWVTSLEPNLDESQMTYRFKKIEKACGLNHQGLYGWHSIRRRLATYLEDIGAGREDIFKFMRWERPKDIMDTYVVRSKSEVERKLAEVDRRIFKVHPFLEAWRE